MGEGIYLYIGFIVIVGIGAIIFNIFRLKKMRGEGEEFLQKYPNAAKLYQKMEIKIISVDGEKPVQTQEKMKLYTYLKPGANIIEASATFSRPGVLHKTVTTTYGPYKLEVTAQSEKDYMLSFDKKAEQFTFEEK